MQIKGKIIAAILICTLGVAGIIGIFSTVKIGTIIKQETIASLQEKANSYGNQIDQKLKRIQLQGEYLASAINNSVNANKIKMFLINYKRNTIKPLIKRTAQLEGIKGAYFYFNPQLIGKANDVWFANSKQGEEEYVKQPEIPKSEYSRDNQEMAWYYQAVDANGAIWTNPHPSRVDDTTVVSYNRAIYKGDLLIGVVGINFNFGEISQIVNKLKIKQSGYGFLLNDQFQFLLHPNYQRGDQIGSVDNNQLQPVVDKINSTATGIAKYSVENQQKTVGYTHLSNGWVLGLSLAKREMFARRNRLVLLLTLICLVGSVLAVAGSYYFGGKISEPIEEVVEHCNQMAEGDFTYQLESELTTRSDEIGDLATSFNRVVDYVHDMVTSIRSSVDNLSLHSDQLSNSARAGTETITATKQVINEMSVSIEQISGATNRVVELAQTSDSKAVQGSQNIVNTLEKMKEINYSVDQTVEIIEELDSTSQEIEKIIEMIANIADQTNLLALNASIEAARAGTEASNKTAGQGFAVVAEEIRELAAETSQATEEITELINKTQTKANQGVQAVKSVKNKVAEGNQLAEETREVTKKIIDASQNTTEQIRKTAQAADDLANNSEEIVDDTEQIEVMSAEINNSAEELAEITTNLEELISQFKV